MNTFSKTFVVLLLPVLLSACGESGSEPDQYSEVQYQVSQEGGGTFSLVAMNVAGRKRQISPDRVFTAFGPVGFNVEGAPGPYFAEFCRRSGGEMTIGFIADSSQLPGQVILTFKTAGTKGVCRNTADICESGVGSGECLSDTDCATGQLCEKRLFIAHPQGTTRPGDEPLANPDVRFEVCVPIPGNSNCTTDGDPPNTVFGRFQSGSVGDIASTFLVSDNTPVIYFLTTAKDNVNGIFRAANNEFLYARLFVNNVQKDSHGDTDDVVIRHDL